MSAIIGILVVGALAALIFNPLTLRLFYFLSGDQAGEYFGLSGAPTSRVHQFYRCASNSKKCRDAYDKGFTRGSSRGTHNRKVMAARGKEYANSINA